MVVGNDGIPAEGSKVVVWVAGNEPVGWGIAEAIEIQKDVVTKELVSLGEEHPCPGLEVLTFLEIVRFLID